MPMMGLNSFTYGLITSPFCPTYDTHFIWCGHPDTVGE